MIDPAAAAQNAMRIIAGTSVGGGKPILLVGCEDDRAATLAALSTLTGVAPVNLNAEFSQALIDADGTRVNPAAIIANMATDASPLLIDRIHVLMLPQLRINALDVLTRVARRRTVCATWPGRLENRRLRYADRNHPECLDEDANRALVVDLSINEGTYR
ncbi:MAG TPA: BREX-3 system P-loop-containing protein BrxF [Allosphingosinicella sp.]|nr:BREX-3 system P-loop-containing protein BrxF [Allosphingosinicella sp.]